MHAKTNAEYAMDLSRAIRNTQRILLRNNLDPFEFVVDIHATRGDEGERTYELAIAEAGGAVMVRKSGIPRGCIEHGWDGNNSVEFARLVQSFIPDLLERIRLSKEKKPAVRVNNLRPVKAS